MDKKILMKIRLKQDGTWEHVYNDGSVDQEFYELNIVELARIQREKLFNQSQDYLEQAVELSGYKDAKEVIDHIQRKTK
jgi:hypothetical protein